MIKGIKEKIREMLSQHKKRNILIVMFILVILLSSSILLISYSYYSRNSNNLIFKGIVKIEIKADVIFKMYLENNIGGYSLTEDIPSNDYLYNHSKTVCDENIKIDDVTHGIFTLSASGEGECRVYMDKIDFESDDLVLNIYAQDVDGEDNPLDTYSLVATLPNDRNYVLNDKISDCTQGTEFDENGALEASGQGACNVFYDIAS